MGLKLHLGCGQNRLEGYLNIDFPAEAHSVQPGGAKADLFADLRTLRFGQGEVEEVRLHHVFEHFTRPVACGLLAAWQSWLEPGGRLRIEVPDFTGSAMLALNPLARLRDRRVALRHLFGSHEAPWAVHCEGWSASNLKSVAAAAGFVGIQTRRWSWKALRNLELTALKGQFKERGQMREDLRAFLSSYLVDDSQTEQRLLEVWLLDLDRQWEASWAG